MRTEGMFNKECDQVKACEEQKRALMHIKGKFNGEQSRTKAYRGGKDRHKSQIRQKTWPTKGTLGEEKSFDTNKRQIQ